MLLFLSKELADVFTISSLPVITKLSETIFMQVQLLNNKKNHQRPKHFLLGKKKRVSFFLLITNV